MLPTMKKLLSCEFNIDTACVEKLSIYTPGIEDSLDTTPAMRTELDWLVYNAPLEYARRVLDGSLEEYVRSTAGTHGMED